MTSSFETTTCRNCQGFRCIHCGYRGEFRKRLSPNPRLDPERATVLRFLRSGSSQGSLRGGAGILERTTT